MIKEWATLVVIAHKFLKQSSGMIVILKQFFVCIAYNIRGLFL